MSWKAKLLLCLLPLALLSACHQEPVTPTPSMAVATPTPAAAASRIEVAMPEQADSWHPLLTRQRDIQSLLALVYEPLITLDDSGQPVGCLAADWRQEVCDWTFTLRNQAQWQQTGRSFSAGDAVHTLDLIRQIGENGPWYWVLNSVESWEAMDDSTLCLHMKNASWGNLLALTFPIVPIDAGYTAEDCPDIAAGTGPYRMEAAPGEALTLLRSDTWWKQKPSIQQIHASAYRDAKSASSALVLQQLDALQSDDLVSEQFSYGGDVKTYQYVTPYFEFLAFQCEGELTGSADFRNAVALAIDRQDLAENVYMTHATLTDSPLIPNKALYGSNDPAPRDLEAAKALLSHFHGLEDQPLTLLASENKANPLRQEAAEHIAQQLAQAGISVNVVTKPWEEYVKSLETGDYDMALAGWYLSQVPNLHLFLDEDGAQNIFRYSSVTLSEAMDALDQAGKNAFSSAAKALSQRLAQERPFVSLYFLNHTLLTSARIRGVGHIEENSAFSSIENWLFSSSGY